MYNSKYTGAEVEAKLDDVQNKVSKNADVGTDGAYVIMLDSDNKEWRVPKATMVSLMADGIKAVANEQAKVAFGATTLPELATVVARQSPFIGTSTSFSSSTPNNKTSYSVDFFDKGVEGNPDTTSQWFIKTEKYSSLNSDSWLSQTAIGIDNKNIYMRECWGGRWGNWRNIYNFGANSLSELGTKMYGAGDIAGLANTVSAQNAFSSFLKPVGSFSKENTSYINIGTWGLSKSPRGTYIAVISADSDISKSVVIIFSHDGGENNFTGVQLYSNAIELVKIGWYGAITIDKGDIDTVSGKLYKIF